MTKASEIRKLRSATLFCKVRMIQGFRGSALRGKEGHGGSDEGRERRGRALADTEDRPLEQSDCDLLDSILINFNNPVTDFFLLIDIPTPFPFLFRDVVASSIFHRYYPQLVSKGYEFYL